MEKSKVKVTTDNKVQEIERVVEVALHMLDSLGEYAWGSEGPITKFRVEEVTR